MQTIKVLGLATALTLLTGSSADAGEGWGPLSFQPRISAGQHAPFVAPPTPFRWGHFGAQAFPPHAKWARGYNGTPIRWNQYRQY